MNLISISINADLSKFYCRQSQVVTKLEEHQLLARFKSH